MATIETNLESNTDALDILRRLALDDDDIALLVKSLWSGVLPIYCSTFNKFMFWDTETLLWNQSGDDMYKFGKIVKNTILPQLTSIDIKHKDNIFANNLHKCIQRIPRITTRSVIIRQFKRLCYADVQWNKISNCAIPIAHGMLLDVSTGNIRKRTHTDYYIEEFPVSHNPEVGCEPICDMLRKMSGGNDDTFERLCDAITNHIVNIRSNRVLVHGLGSNGKTTLQQILRNFTAPYSYSYSVSGQGNNLIIDTKQIIEHEPYLLYTNHYDKGFNPLSSRSAMTNYRPRNVWATTNISTAYRGSLNRIEVTGVFVSNEDDVDEDKHRYKSHDIDVQDPILLSSMLNLIVSRYANLRT